MVTNYNLEMEKLIANLKDHNQKLLLHCCCGPCSTACITRLKDFFDITVYYYNPSIYPKEEFEKRRDEQIKFINILNKTENRHIKVIVPEYNPKTYYKAISKVKNFQNLKEGYERCYACYEERLVATAKFAKENGYDYFGTTLSVSPYKHSNWLNEIGLKLQDEFDIKFLVADFKKKEGYKLSQELSKKYDLYRQHYCGCVYSLTYDENKKEEESDFMQTDDLFSDI